VGLNTPLKKVVERIVPPEESQISFRTSESMSSYLIWLNHTLTPKQD
jgi:hypothetical protein